MFLIKHLSLSEWTLSGQKAGRLNFSLNPKVSLVYVVGEKKLTSINKYLLSLFWRSSASASLLNIIIVTSCSSAQSRQQRSKPASEL